LINIMSKLLASCRLASLALGSLALGTLVLSPLAALAQTTAKQPASATVPSSAPPQTGQLESGPEIKPVIPKDIPDREGTGPDGPKQTQRKVQGKVVETEVKRGNNTYYVKPNDTPGSIAHDAQSNEVRGAQWKVYEFKPGKRKPQAASSAPAAASASASASNGSLAPPPPAAPLETK
jgi:hypothetical protein